MLLLLFIKIFLKKLEYKLQQSTINVNNKQIICLNKLFFFLNKCIIGLSFNLHCVYNVNYKRYNFMVFI